VPFTDRAIGTLKQWLPGTHHGVSRHLQAYLVEFVFRHNWRKQPTGPVQALLGIASGHKSTTYKDMRSRRKSPIRQVKADPNILGFAETTG